MNVSAPRLRRLVTTGLVLAGLAATAAQAQTPAPKPAPKPAPAAAKPAEKPAEKSLAGTTPGGRMMDIDELRACLNQQDELARRRAAVEAERGPLDQEKDALLKEKEALAAERGQIDAARQQVADLNARFKAFGERIEAWNARAKEVQGRSGATADRERAALDKDRAELQKAQAELEAERNKIGDGPQTLVAAFNAKAGALDQKVQNWNERNAAAGQRAVQLNQDRNGWVETCGNRRYREEDEQRIRQGK